MDTASPNALHPTANVLSVTTFDDDRASLGRIFDRSLATLCPDCRWNLATRSSLESAMPLLERDEVAILLYDGDVISNTWREMLSRCEHLKHPPCLIVTSSRADERLWAEALNLGAYDVLAKPFDVTEVSRTLSRAFRHWTDNMLSPVN